MIARPRGENLEGARRADIRAVDGCVGEIDPKRKTETVPAKALY
jgi:hypothetical protein